MAEEVGLEIKSVSYKSSQHWPFPAGSVMIGVLSISHLFVGRDQEQKSKDIQ